MLRRLTLMSLLLFAPLGAAQAADMTVGAFLSRAAPLRANPLLALMSPDYPVLKDEARQATRALRADAARRRAAGKRPIACLPDGESPGIEQMLDGLDRLPAADKRLPLKDGYAKVLARDYPC